MFATRAEPAIIRARSPSGNGRASAPGGCAVRRRCKSAPAATRHYNRVDDTPISDQSLCLPFTSPYILSRISTVVCRDPIRLSAVEIPIKPSPVAAVGVTTPVEDLDVYTHTTNNEYQGPAKTPDKILSDTSISLDSVSGHGDFSFESQRSYDTSESSEQSLPASACKNNAGLDHGDAVSTDKRVPLVVQVSPAICEADLLQDYRASS